MRLVTTMRDDHRLLEHGERMLAPLIEYDLARDGDLLDVLAAMKGERGRTSWETQAAPPEQSPES